MEFLTKLFTFITTNYDMILSSVVAILLALGAVAESLNTILGGKESALTKVAKWLAKAGEVVKKFSDLLKPKK